MRNYAELISATVRRTYAAKPCDIDQLEIRDAYYEDANGNMPWDAEYDESLDTNDRELDERRIEGNATRID